MEAVGLAASLMSLLEISGKIVAAGYDYMSKVAHAPTRMRMILSEVSSVNLVLGRLEEYAADQSASGRASILYTLSQAGVFEDCKEALKTVDGTVHICMAESEAHSSKRELKALVKRVIWPMKEKETEEILGNLDRIRSILSDAIAQDSAASIHRLEETTRQLHQTTTKMASTQRYAEIMAWVCPYNTDPFDNYHAALKSRQPGTGDWLAKSESFQAWSQHDHGLFWLRGLPGCGKTVLTSTVVEYIQNSLTSKDDGITLAYFYIDYRDPAKQNLDACLATLVRQMIDQNPKGIAKLERLKEQKQRSLSQNLTTNEYIGILQILASLQTKAYVVIDALDETSDPGPFVDALKQIAGSDCKTPTAVFVSSRNNTDLENILKPIVTSRVFVSNEENHDVRLFIDTEVKQRFTSVKLKVPDVEIINLTIAKLVARADGLFLQARLLLDFVFEGKTSRSVRKALTELPNGLEATYEMILRRTTSQNRRHVREIKRCLQWLSMSFTPLTPSMLVEAAAIDRDDTFLDPEACMNEDDLIGMLSSLILVDWNRTPPVVSLAHQTVLEYFQSKSILQSDMSRYHIDASTVHQYLAETSVQYLLFPDSAKSLMKAARFRPPQTALQSSHHDPFETASTLACTLYPGLDPEGYGSVSDLQHHSVMEWRFPSLSNTATWNTAEIGPCLTHASQEQALLNYAANLWPEHLKSSGYATDDFNASIARKLQWFLDPWQNHCPLYEAWEAFQRRRLSSSLYFVGRSRASDQQIPLFRKLLKSSYFAYIGHETTQDPLFYTVLYGLDGCFDLLESHYDVDMCFLGGWTPLTVAAASGSFSIAKKLLEAGASVNKPADMHERNGLTPLHIAAELAMDDLVEMFLSHGASIISLTATMTTPFYRAARGGSVKTLQLLHDAGSDINAPSWDDYTPLMEAVSWANYDTLDLLLSWGADPCLRNNQSESAIDKAVEIGDDYVVEILKSAALRYTPKPVDPRTILYREEITKKTFPNES